MKNRVIISSTKSTRKFAQELAEVAMRAEFFDTCWSAKKKNKVSGPGKMIEALSDQEREVVKQLKPEHFNNRFFNDKNKIHMSGTRRPVYRRSS